MQTITAIKSASNGSSTNDEHLITLDTTPTPEKKNEPRRPRPLDPDHAHPPPQHRPRSPPRPCAAPLDLPTANVLAHAMSFHRRAPSRRAAATSRHRRIAAPPIGAATRPTTYLSAESRMLGLILRSFRPEKEKNENRRGEANRCIERSTCS